jgi:DNA replication and repair protein RecF
LSLGNAGYLEALLRYRSALAQRNAALRQRQPEVAAAFEGPLAQAGAVIVQERLQWSTLAGPAFAAELEHLGEGSGVELTYQGQAELADPAAWPAALGRVATTDRARGTTSIGPHRHDLALRVAGRSLRAFGSTGQLRSAAVALKLLELNTIRQARAEEPVLLLDDVFAELDSGRQDRLARRLDRGPGRQVFVTAPRPDELPRALALPRWRMVAGRASPEGHG